jgi:cell division protease FtsH
MPGGNRAQGCSSLRFARTLEAVDWINERNVHDWLHDAVHVLHLAVGWLHGFLVSWGIFIFLGLLCWLTWKFISMMPNVRPKQLDARADSDVRWDEVAGVEEVRTELEEVVEFLQDPARFAKLGARVPKGVLLYGPPGTGKTLLAKAVANESDASFYFQSASSFVEMWSGLGAARIRRLFQTARKNQPAIIFIDELDAVGRHRGSGGPGGGSQEHDQTLNQLLVEMDGFDQSDRLVVIGASNQLGALDTALLRPGRFDRHIGVSAPDLQGREQILEVHTRGKPLAEGVRLADVARQTSGLTGADLANICNEAAISAGRSERDEIVQADFDYAVERVVAGLQQRRLITGKEKRVIAYHEAGHALVARLMGDAMQLHKVTIVPRGQALGYTLNLPEEDRYLQSTEELRDWLKVILAGRAAEQVVFGRITNGAANDLERATGIARSMVFEWGMGESMPHQQVRADNYALSEETKRTRDAEQRGITDAAYRDALRLVELHRMYLDRLAQALLATETLERAEIDVLLDGLEPESNSSLDIGVEVAALAIAPPPRPAGP